MPDGVIENLVKSWPDLLILVGLILIVSYVADIRLPIAVRPEHRKNAAFLGIALLIAGSGLMAIDPATDYYNNVSLSGRVIYWDGVPAASTDITVDGVNANLKTDENGVYRRERLSRDARLVSFNLPWSSCTRMMDVSSLSMSEDISIIWKKANLTISGTVLDEFGDPESGSKVVVSPTFAANERDHFRPIARITDNQGWYQIDEIVFDPKLPTYVTVFSGNSSIPVFKTALKVTENEADTGFKELNIRLPMTETVDVSGQVFYKINDSFGRPLDSLPVQGVIVNMGQKFSISTDRNGSFNMSMVPRNITEYRVRDLNGHLVGNGTIMPPLSSFEGLSKAPVNIRI